MMLRQDMRSIWEEVQANSAKLHGCARHRFGGDFQIGKRKLCEACGGSMALSDIGNYIRGYEAAGGDANDIWPDYRKPKGEDNGS